ncbi:peptidase C14, caspase catalytic subunit p20 [Roseibium sp. TrichSKD4]|nr:peptidase C14, caspase catalytic subunit p20 [Roseibium sp. TrichSKD4]
MVRSLRKRGHTIDSIAHFGDTLTQIAAAGDYKSALEKTNYDVFLLCGSGNDLLGGGDLYRHLRVYDKDREPEDYLKASFFTKLAHMETLYCEIIEETLEHSQNGDIKILSHGYDYAFPQNGYWIGKPMARQGILKQKLGKKIVVVMIDHLYGMLRRVKFQYPGRFDYANFRGIVGSRWHDELHPKKKAFKDLAKKLEKKF